MRTERVCKLTVAGIFGFTVCSLAAGIGGQGRGNVTMQARYQAIESKARLAKPDDESTIRALVDEVCSFPRAFPRMPSVLEDFLKDRLVKAEAAYLRGDTAGVQEDSIVGLIDSFADKFHLPDYSRTSLRQVRVLRMSLTSTTPVFMGRGMVRPGMEFGDSINSAVSPLQAFHLTATLIDQKLLNPDFQVTPTEWDSVFYQRYAERLQARERLRESGQLQEFPRRAQAIVWDNTRQTEIRNALQRGLASTSMSDSFTMLEQAITTLGIGTSGN